MYISLTVTRAGRVTTQQIASATSSGFSMTARRSRLGGSGRWSTNGVSTSPGLMAQARIPCRPCSWLIDSVKDSSARFDAQ